MSHSIENTSDDSRIDLEENSLLDNRSFADDQEKQPCLSRNEKRRTFILLIIALTFVVFCVSMFLLIHFEGLISIK